MLAGIFEGVEVSADISTNDKTRDNNCEQFASLLGMLLGSEAQIMAGHVGISEFRNMLLSDKGLLAADEIGDTALLKQLEFLQLPTLQESIIENSAYLKKSKEILLSDLKSLHAGEFAEPRNENSLLEKYEELTEILDIRNHKALLLSNHKGRIINDYAEAASESENDIIADTPIHFNKIYEAEKSFREAVLEKVIKAEDYDNKKYIETESGEKIRIMRNINSKIEEIIDSKDDAINDLIAKGQEPDTRSVGDKKGIEFAVSSKFDFFMKEVAQENIERMISGMRLAQKEGETRIEIQLKPEVLGKLKIEMISQDGKISAHFITNNMYAKELLETNLSALRGMLSDLNLSQEDTTAMDLSVGYNNSQAQEEQSKDGFMNRDYSDDVPDGKEIDTRKSETPKNRYHTGMIDYFA